MPSIKVTLELRVIASNQQKIAKSTRTSYIEFNNENYTLDWICSSDIGTL